MHPSSRALSGSIEASAGVCAKLCEALEDCDRAGRGRGRANHAWQGSRMCTA